MYAANSNNVVYPFLKLYSDCTNNGVPAHVSTKLKNAFLLVNLSDLNLLCCLLSLTPQEDVNLFLDPVFVVWLICLGVNSVPV